MISSLSILTGERVYFVIIMIHFNYTCNVGRINNVIPSIRINLIKLLFEYDGDNTAHFCFAEN